MLIIVLILKLKIYKPLTVRHLRPPIDFQKNLRQVKIGFLVDDVVLLLRLQHLIESITNEDTSTLHQVPALDEMHRLIVAILIPGVELADFYPLPFSVI